MRDLERENYILRVRLHEANKRIAELSTPRRRGRRRVQRRLQCRPRYKGEPALHCPAGRYYARVAASVESYLGVSGFGDPMSKTSARVLARRIGWLALRDSWERVLSYPEIGRVAGRDHSTVLTGIRCARAALASDPELAAFVSGLVHEKKEAA